MLGTWRIGWHMFAMFVAFECLYNLHRFAMFGHVWHLLAPFGTMFDALQGASCIFELDATVGGALGALVTKVHWTLTIAD